MSKKKSKERERAREREDVAFYPWQAFIVSSNESTGMIPAIFDDDMIETYGSIYAGMDTFPGVYKDKYGSQIEPEETDGAK